MKKFKFLSGKIEKLTFVQRRYPRIFTRNIPYPEEYSNDLKGIFRNGWRTCERGGQIYDNPYSHVNELIYARHEAWERGWLECYHNHPSRRGQTNLECYERGWEFAQNGLPLSSNPFPADIFEHILFIRGWNDFVNTH
jgi:hypothetical protein